MGKINLAVQDSDEKALNEGLKNINIPVEHHGLEQIMKILQAMKNAKPNGTLVVGDIQDALQKGRITIITISCS